MPNRSSLIDLQSMLFPLYSNCILKPYADYKFSNEKELFKGKNISKSNRQSICLFTTHKCASTFFARLLKLFENVSDYKNINFEGYMYLKQLNKKEIFVDEAFLNDCFKTKGYIYGPLRTYIEIPDIEEYKVVLILRDPRDVMVSHYFSMAYSHKMINKDFFKLRKNALSKTIDELVFEISDYYYETYKNYSTLLNNKNMMFVSYDHIISSPAQFLNKILDFTCIDLNEDQKNNILMNELNYSSQKSMTEKFNHHRRSGKSGDYKNKLKPETIDLLNQKFEEIIKVYGFTFD
jgi:hypothetical protein